MHRLSLNLVGLSEAAIYTRHQSRVNSDSKWIDSKSPLALKAHVARKIIQNRFLASVLGAPKQAVVL